MIKAIWNSGFHTEPVLFIRTVKTSLGCSDLAEIKTEHGDRNKYVLKSEIQFPSQNK